MAAMSDLAKLRVLLPHWIEHNDEHVAEFQEWAEKARAAGQEDMAEEISRAAGQLKSVNEALAAALEKLEQSP